MAARKKSVLTQAVEKVSKAVRPPAVDYRAVLVQLQAVLHGPAQANALVEARRIVREALADE